MSLTMPLVFCRPDWRPMNAWQMIAWAGFMQCILGKPPYTPLYRAVIGA